MASGMPVSWEEAREMLNISDEKVNELREQGVEVRDLFFMTAEDLREFQLSTITRSRIAQRRPDAQRGENQTPKEKEFSIGLTGVKTFDGTSEDYENFLFQLESFVKDEGVRTRVAIAKLDGNALKWYITVGKTFAETSAGWQALKVDMNQIFSDPHLKSRATELLRSKKWKHPVEKAQEYALSTLELCRRARILTEAEQMEQLRLGLNAETKRFILLAKPASISHFIQALVEYESTLAVKEKEINSLDFKPQQICKRCGRKGHVKEKCWSKQHVDGRQLEGQKAQAPNRQSRMQELKCFRCEGAHRVSDCPFQVTKDGDEIKLTRNYFYYQDGSRTHEAIVLSNDVAVTPRAAPFSGRVKVKIGNQKTNALIDSGASVSVVSEHLARNLKIRKQIVGNCNITTANNSALSTTRSFEIPVKIGDAIKELTVVATEENLPEQAILGRDAQEVFDYTIQKQGLGIDNRLIKWNSSNPLRARHTSKILAHSICVIQFTFKDGKHNTPKEIHSNKNLNSEGLSIVEGIFSNSRNVLVMNHSDHDRIIKKGEVLGFAQTRSADEICNINSCTEEEAQRMIQQMKEKGLLEKQDSGNSYKKVKINPQLTPKEKQQLEELVEEFKSIFAEILEHPANLPPMPIELLSEEPIVWRPSARVPFKWREFVDDMIEQALNQGVIKPSSSPFSAPIVVTMTAGKLRMCIDYRGLNLKTKSIHSIIPRIDEIFMKLKGSTYISTSDCTLGYNQMKIRDEDTHKTAFSCHRGQFEYVFAPLGLKNVPRYYNDSMRAIFKPLDFIQTYFDDVACHSKSFDDHLEHLRKMFSICRENKITLKGSKTSLAFSSLEYLGHEVSSNTIKPKLEKARAIAEFPLPETLKQAIEFISLANYYRSFVPQFSTIAYAFQKMINISKGKRNLKWTKEARESFEQIRKLIGRRIELTIPDPTKSFDVTIDSSEKGWGLELRQEHGVVLFNSGSFTPAQSKYSPCERECLGIILGLEKVKDFLIGGCFNLFTDCRAIKWIRESKNDSPKLFRWAERLAQFDMKIHHIAGKSIPHVDAISRNPSKTIIADPTDVHQQEGGNISQQINALLDHEQIAMNSQTFNSKESFSHEVERLLSASNKQVSVIFPKENEIEKLIEKGANYILTPCNPGASWFQKALKKKIIFIQPAITINEIDPALEQHFVIIQTENSQNNVLKMGQKFNKKQVTIRPKLWKEILEAAHNHPWSGHVGLKNTLKRINHLKKKLEFN